MAPKYRFHIYDFRTSRRLLAGLVACFFLASNAFCSATIPFITANLTATAPNHNNGGLALPGDTITYAAKISNTGSANATGVALNVTLDANTTLVPGSINVSPYTIDELVSANFNAGTSITLAAVDADGDALTYTITNQPAHGTATQDNPGSANVTYTPTNGYSGTDSFTFKANDGKVDSNEDGVVSLNIPATAASAPTNVVGVSGNGQATITFTAPASNGGSNITGYTATASPGGATGVSNGNNTTITITGLTNGVAYTFTVTATNGAGTSTSSSPSNAITPATTPGAPTNVVAVGSNGQVTLNFTAPASNGGSAITGYTATASPGGTTGVSIGNNTNITVTGLINGVSYTFTVTATNGAGTSPPSSPSNAATPITVPRAPTNVVATGGNGQATLTFTAPAQSGGSSITGYTATASPGGATGTCGANNFPGITVPGLTNGVSYTFTVTATNGAGVSAPSSPSNAVTPATVPDAPTNVVGTSGDGQVALTFTAPDTDGGSGITGYTATSSPGGFTGVSNGNNTNITVAGLTDGVAYTFKVTATNSVGTSASSQASNSVTPAGVPAAPTNVVAVAGSGQATIVFTAPASNGASITGYTATSSPGGITGTSVGNNTVIVVTGLTNGVNYTFTVTATNSAGTSAVSNASNSATPATVPSAPTNVVGVSGNGQATITFTAPSSNGGANITGYLATASPGGATGVSSGTNPTITISGLTNGVSYTFTVTATNSAGVSTPSSPSNAITPATVPSAPTNVVGFGGNGLVNLTFTAPTSNGGSSVTGYTATANPSGVTGVSNGDNTNITIVGLTNGVSYTFTVTATNGAGTGAPSTPSNAVTPATAPSSPFNVVGVGGNGQATLTFSVPTSNGGSPITGYTATASPGGATGVSSGTNTTITISGLTNGVNYTFTVTATNSAGVSTPSNPSNAVTPATVPSAPTNVIGFGGNGQASLTFTAPTSNGGSSITGYTATASPGGFTGVSNGNNTNITIVGLTNGVNYTFTVTATNGAGVSAPSSPSNFVTPATAPSSPFNVVGVGGNGQATLTFSVPTSNGGSPITGYTATSSPGGITGTSIGNNTTIVVTGLTNGVNYTFTVTATNSAGTGALSTQSNSITPVTVPDAPTNVVGTSGDGQANVTFSAPDTNGGSTITGYTVTASPGGATGTGDVNSPTNGIIVSGLTDGVAYTFTVTATNGVGTSASSQASSAVTPAGLPSAPTNVVGFGGNGLANLTFTAPTSNGGSSITGYTATASPGGFTGVSNGNNTNITIVGLTNGVSYTFTVTATNGAGTGAPSSPSNAVIPATAPSSPFGVVGVGGNGQATLTFSIPTSNGGSPITGYTATSSPGGITGTSVGASNTIVVTGLTNGVSYTFTVTATNSAGTGAPSSPSNAITPATVPGAPTNVQGTAGDSEVSLTFTAPSSNGGSSITGYTATSSPGGITGVSSGNATNITVSSLTDGVSYTFTVTATNSAGQSPPSSPSASISPIPSDEVLPAPPTNVIATKPASGSNSITVSWTPTGNAHEYLTRYIITCTDPTVSPTFVRSVSSSIHSINMTSTSGTGGYQCCTPYAFVVVSVNLRGESANSTASNNSEPFCAQDCEIPDLDGPQTVAKTASLADNGTLDESTLAHVVAEARLRWEATGLTAAQRKILQNLDITLVNRSNNFLGMTKGTHITLNTRPLGNGWYIGAEAGAGTPFKINSKLDGILRAQSGSPAEGRMDLLTTLMHEMGHALGLPDYKDAAHRNDIMYGYLERGERRLPAMDEVKGVVPNPNASDDDDDAQYLQDAVNSGVTIGTLPPGKSVTVTVNATINNPLPNTTRNITAQGTVTGSNFSDVQTNDPAVSGSGNPTVISAYSGVPTGLTVSGITASDKVYDGTTNASLSTTNAALVGVLSVDNGNVGLVTSNAVGTFVDQNFGLTKTVNVSGLTLSGSGAIYYSLTQPTTTASISAGTLTVTVDNLSRVFGTDNPTLTATITGYVNGENALSAITGAPDISTPATINSLPSLYPITATIGSLAANNNNYTFSLTFGTLTVVARAYSDWGATYFTPSQLLDSSISGSNVDLLNQGVPNLLAYSFNLNPTQPNRDGLPTVGQVTVNAQQYLAITYTQLLGVSDLTYTIQSSTDLVTWTPVNTAPVATVNNGLTATVTVRDTTALAPGELRFLRVMVTQSPNN